MQTSLVDNRGSFVIKYQVVSEKFQFFAWACFLPHPLYKNLLITYFIVSLM